MEEPPQEALSNAALNKFNKLRRTTEIIKSINETKNGEKSSL